MRGFQLTPWILYNITIGFCLFSSPSLLLQQPNGLLKRIKVNIHFPLCAVGFGVFWDHGVIRNPMIVFVLEKLLC